MSLGDRLGILGLIVALFAIASFYLWPDKKGIGWVSLTVAGVLLVLWGVLEYQGRAKTASMRGHIDTAILGAQGQRASHAGLVVSLTNQGSPSAIVPSSWSLTAVTSGQLSFNGEPITLVDKNLDFCFPPNHVRRFVREDALYLKTETPIAENGSVQGFLWFKLSSLDLGLLADDRTELHLSFMSVTGKVTEVVTTILELKRRTSESKFFPGLRYPREIVIPCKENTPY